MARVCDAGCGLILAVVERGEELRGLLRGSVVFVNLTAGLEWLPELRELGLGLGELRFCRLPSSLCEQGLYNEFLARVPDEMLLRLALGQRVAVLDTSSRWSFGVSRALWQGLAYLAYVLNALWFGERCAPRHPKGFALPIEVFERALRRMPDPLKRRIEYYRHFLATDRIELLGISRRSLHDGDWSWYRAVLAG